MSNKKLLNVLSKPTLYVITDCKVHDHVYVAEKSLEAGVKIIQYREKRKCARDMYTEAKKIAEICKSYDALFIVDDRLDLALATDADGVHVGQEDLPAWKIRELFSGIIGVSVKTVKQAKEAEKYADYLGAGAVYPTKTKSSSTIGIEGLKKIIEAVKLPVVGIGGINKHNLLEVALVGASVAVVSAVAHAKDVKKAAMEMLDTLASLNKN